MTERQTVHAGPTRTCLGCRQRLSIGTLIGVRRGPQGLEVERLAGWPVPGQASTGRPGVKSEGTHLPTRVQTVQRVVDCAARDSGGAASGKQGRVRPGQKRNRSTRSWGYVCPSEACVERAWRSRSRKAAMKSAITDHGPPIEAIAGEAFTAADWLHRVSVETELWLLRRADGLRRRRLDDAADPRIEAWKALVQRARNPESGPQPRKPKGKGVVDHARESGSWQR